MKQVKVNKDGWSRWENPIMDGYLMGCCDCGLVHEVEFHVVKVIGKKKNGWMDMKKLPKDKYRIAMRARRTTPKE